MAASIYFKRGDGITHQFVIPTANWSQGGKLWFGAKLAPDDDTTDAAAIIEQTWTDANAVNDGTNVTYTCYFPPSATASIAMNGAAQIIAQGEFQWVSSSGVPSTFPGNGQYIQTYVYSDIVRRTS